MELDQDQYSRINQQFRLFVYGSLKRGFRNHYFIKNGKFLGEATLKGYEMYSLSCFPAIVKGLKESVVHGELYMVDRYQLKRTDKLESRGKLFDLIVEPMDFNGESIKALVYMFLWPIDNYELIQDGKWTFGKASPC